MNSIPAFEDHCPALYEWSLCAKEWEGFQAYFGFELHQSKNISTSHEDTSRGKSTNVCCAGNCVLGKNDEISSSTRKVEVDPPLTTSSRADVVDTSCVLGICSFMERNVFKNVFNKSFVSEVLQRKIFSRKNVLKAQIHCLSVLKGAVHVAPEVWLREYENLLGTEKIKKTQHDLLVQANPIVCWDRMGSDCLSD